MPRGAYHTIIDVPAAGRVVREAREKLGHTQEKFRKKYRISRWVLLNFERGSCTPATFPQFVALSRDYPQLLPFVKEFEAQLPPPRTPPLAPAPSPVPPRLPSQTVFNQYALKLTAEDRALFTRAVIALETMASYWKPVIQ